MTETKLPLLTSVNKHYLTYVFENMLYIVYLKYLSVVVMLFLL